MIAIITTGGVAILITSCATLIAALGGLSFGRRNRQTVVEVHAMVNGTLTALRERTAQLERAIVASGGTVPPDPAVAA